MYERQSRVTAYRFNGRLISVSPLLLTPACSFPRALRSISLSLPLCSTLSFLCRGIKGRFDELLEE